jgi:hypothetical protein
MRIPTKRIVAAQGFVSKKRNYFDKLNITIWFLQLVVSYIVALS